MTELVPQSWLVFLLALWPAQLLGIVWHELGHVLAARAAGLPVLAWGVGARKPMVWFRQGKSVFYVARPMSMGLTICLAGLLERRPRATMIMVLGGPAASLLGLAGGLAAWWWGARSDLLLAWIAMSILLSLTSTIPFTLRKGPIRLDNDARSIIDLAMHGPVVKVVPVGASLSNLRTIEELLAGIGAEPGARYFRAAGAIGEAMLGDFKTAGEHLATVEGNDDGRVPGTLALAGFARAIIAVEQKADDAPQRIDAAASLGAADPTAQFLLDCLREQWRLQRGDDVKTRASELSRRAEGASRGDWLCAAGLLMFDANPAEDPEAQCREFFHRNALRLSDAGKAHVLAATTERLATNGMHEQARRLFAEAQQAIRDTAALIAEPATRQAFVERAAAPLQRAVMASHEGMPLFMAEAPVAAKLVKPQWAYTTLFFGVVAVLSSLLIIAIDRNRAGLPDPKLIEKRQLATTLPWVSALITSVLSVLLGERAIKVVCWGLLLAFLGLLLGIATAPTQPVTKSQVVPFELKAPLASPDAVAPAAR